LTSTLTREARDEVLDATTGSFTSHAFSFSPGWLGSDLPHIKYFGQYFHYFPLQPPQRKRFTNEILRPRLVFATGVRLGLARGIGGVVPTSERFFAGGSTTLRGFAQNAVGPIGLDRVPVGGNAMLVLNNELRFPLVSILDGVTFVDVGGVFPRISEFSLRDLRESAGVGLRVRTPWFLLRGDYGFVLDHRPGERRSRFYFSIGQAF
jgi:outer membrane protein assembly factor BamA